MSHRPNPDKYVLVKTSLEAGLGDSLLTLIKGIAYAKLTDRILCVDWRGGHYGLPEEDNLFDRLIKIRGIPYTKEIPSEGSVFPPVWQGCTHRTLEFLLREKDLERWNMAFGRKNYSADAGKLDYDQDILVFWEFYDFEKILDQLKARGIISQTACIHAARGEIFEQFASLTERPKQYFEENWIKIRPNEAGGRLIGVHVRDTEESMRVFGSVKRKSYFKIVDKILKDDPKVTGVFLATDNEAAQKEFTTRYGNKVFFKPKWFSKPGDPIHLGLEKCPDNWENLLSAIFDKFGLARCDYLVRREASSFSETAQCLGKFERGNVRLIHRHRSLGERVVNRLKTIAASFVAGIG